MVSYVPSTYAYMYAIYLFPPRLQIVICTDYSAFCCLCAGYSCQRRVLLSAVEIPTYMYTLTVDYGLRDEGTCDTIRSSVRTYSIGATSNHSSLLSWVGRAESYFPILARNV